MLIIVHQEIRAYDGLENCSNNPDEAYHTGTTHGKVAARVDARTPWRFFRATKGTLHVREHSSNQLTTSPVGRPLWPLVPMNAEWSNPRVWANARDSTRASSITEP